MYFKYLLILCSLIIPSKIFAYSFDQKTSNKKSEIFYDFSKMPNYYLPHKYNTTKKAAVIENGVLKLTVKPGMRGSSGDKKCKCRERAELGFRTPINGTTYYSFKFRTDGDGKSNTRDENGDHVRTMIAQIKPKPNEGSPPMAVYLEKGGSVKCLEYEKNSADTKSKRIKESQKANQSGVGSIRVSGIKKSYRVDKIKRLLGIDLKDGNWHKIEMTYKPSNTDGYCKIVIDGRTILEKSGIDNIVAKKQLYIGPRIGIYRDNLNYSQTVYYDDLTIKFTPE